MAETTDSPIERYLPGIALGAAALALLALTAGAGTRAAEVAALPDDAIVAIPAAVEAGDAIPMDLLPPAEADERVKALALEAILENPEIVMQAVEILRAEEAAAEAQAAAAAMRTEADALFAGADAPILGNPDGDVTVVEFFDYNCGFCRRAMDTVAGLIAADPGVRLVMREFPILSEESDEAARVALAAHLQGVGYAEMHEAMMRMSGRADEASARAAAMAAGVDMARLEADLALPAIDAHLAESRRLATTLGIGGTPAFVIGDQVIPGAVPLEELQAAVAAARAG